MLSAETVVVTVSAAASSAAITGESLRRYWRRREERQTQDFARRVQAIVDASAASMISRQSQLEKTVGEHLDRQDRDIRQIRRMVERRP